MPSTNALVPGTELGRRSEAAITPLSAESSHRPSAEQKSKRRGWQRCCPWLSSCCPCGKKSGETYDVAEAELENTTGEVTDQTDDQLEVTTLDLLKGSHEVNKRRHHTEEFECKNLIVRRGFPFKIQLTFNRPLNPQLDKLILELKTGNNPQAAKGTHVTLALVEQPEARKWGATVVEKIGDGRGITLSIHSPPTCVVGKYRLSIATQTGTIMGKKLEEIIYILFNPWCLDDIVYMDDEEMREEYVLNETGRIYYGTENQIGARSWSFGQFSEGILDACLFILEKSKMPVAGRGDAISVVRIISAVINSQDDRGVLVGNWSGLYTGGTSPTAWVGSVDILLQYHRTGEPVKFGQCWVFSGVTTTVLRCLGIPTRSVTNFASAHDTDVSLTNDIYLDEEMKPLDHMNYDSIWNFHVWNDCWMARPDLPVGLGGWQAIDATPQETSCGLYCCGPASVEAIRHGMVYLKYDAPFIFAEVNSDKVFWQKQADGTFQKVLVQKRAVGHQISTKAVGSDEREDITESYKYSEGTDEERIAVETACRHGSRPDTYADQWTANDVEVGIRTEDGIIMGSDFTVTVCVANTGTECRSLTLFIQATVMYYTGVTKGTFKKDKQDVLLEPHEEKEVKLLFHYDDYLEFLVDQAAMMFTVTGRVKETGQAIVNQHNFRLRTPDLRVMLQGDATVGKPMKVEIAVTNPLPKTLKNVTLRIEGPGLQRPRRVSVGDVPRHATITITETFIPSKPGQRKLIASLDSQQLTQVHGVAEVLVQEY